MRRAWCSRVLLTVFLLVWTTYVQHARCQTQLNGMPVGSRLPTCMTMGAAGAGLCLLISNFRFGMAEMSEPLSAQAP